MAALTEEQTMLKEQAKTWAAEEAPVSKFREMRDSGNEFGFDKGTWAKIGEMGWPGILIPEAFGGAGQGMLEAAILHEELQVLGAVSIGQVEGFVEVARDEDRASLGERLPRDLFAE